MRWTRTCSVIGQEILTGKDRPVSTPGRRQERQSERSRVSRARRVVSSDAAKGNQLIMGRPICNAVQRKFREPCQNQRRRITATIAGTAKYLKDLENQKVQQEVKFEALDTTLTMYTDSDWLQIQQEQHVRSSCIHQHWGREALDH